jgi:hypothetical protein
MICSHQRFEASTRILIRGRMAPLAALAVAVSLGAGTAYAAGTARVTVGSPPDTTPQNHQNEPAVAIDANDPNVLVAGANDFVDRQPCPQQSATQQGRCSGTPLQDTVGVSGVSFSLDRGNSWVQPAYGGWTKADCAPTGPCDGHPGPIHTLPWYYESNLASAGDPAVAVGPVRGADGRFSWGNGSRIYYANLASTISDQADPAFKGLAAIAVSRTDDAVAAAAGDKNAWMRPVLASQRQSAVTFADKVQVWADNAASSPNFGNVYVCFAQIRGSASAAAPLIAIRSTDGGSSWEQRQITPASNSAPSHFGQSGCTVRSDSHGVVYVFYEEYQDRLPPPGTQFMVKSFDGGVSWTTPRPLFRIIDECSFIDLVSGRCVLDGFAGARTEFAASPSVDIANGAPNGTGATDEIVDSWADASEGLNNERARIAWSTDGGATWGGPTPVSLPGDRPMYAALAISPIGDRAYVVYEADLDPWRGTDMTSPRRYRGVFLQASIAANGTPAGWTTVATGAIGDLKATYPGHDSYQERIGDYVYAAASATYGVGVWTDARNAQICPPVQDYRAASIAAGIRALPAPWPLFTCPTFGNTDIWAATTG